MLEIVNKVLVHQVCGGLTRGFKPDCSFEHHHQANSMEGSCFNEKGAQILAKTYFCIT